ncbi:MAG: tetratricopeptide repeat protein, partial [Planctomycetes bacterium]|nr:tetratricopeptide repeat protein [Planctomycetota bacterium]
LTLQPVFGGQDRQELLRQIAFDEPRAPRRLNKAVSEELEIIVLKAMAKNPAERYDTAQELADDLRRFLEDRPIRARRPTLVQRAAKWSRRHKPLVWSAAVSTFLLLVVGLVGLGIGNRLIAKEQARTENALGESREAERKEAEQRTIAEARRLEAEKERRRAEKNYRLARRAVDRLFTRVAERLQDKPHMEQIRRELLEDALEFYQGFLKERSDNPELKMETALAHRRAGEIQGLLGDWEKSLANHQGSAKILIELNRLSPDNIDYRAHVARSRDYLADALTRLARFKEAETHIESGIAMCEELVESHPRIPEYLEDLVRLHRRGARVGFCQYKWKESHKYAAQSNEMIRRLSKDFPNYPVEEQLLTVTYGNRGLVKDIESLMDSERKIREEIKLLEEKVQAHPDAPDYQGSLCGELANLKRVLLAMDRFEDLEPLGPKAIALHEKLAEDHPGILDYHKGLGWSRYTCGLFSYYMGREAEATEHFRVGIEIASKVLESDPDNARHLSHLLGMLMFCPARQFREPERALQLATRQLQFNGSAWNELAFAEVRAGKYKEALTSCKKAMEVGGTGAQVAAVAEAMAEWHIRDKEEARRKFVLAATAVEEDPGRNRYRYTLEWRLLRREVEEMMGINRDSDDWTLWHARATACVQLKQWDKAIEDYDEAIRLDPDNPGLYRARAYAHRQLKQWDKAIANYSEAIRLAPENAGLYAARSEAYLALGRYDEALADCDKHVELRPDGATAALIRAQMLVMADRTEEYRQACVEMLDRFGQSKRPGEFCHAAWACVLAPKAIPDPMVPVELAERAVSRDPNEWTLYVLGMAHFRAGQLGEAAERFHESLNAGPHWDAIFLNWLGLALVHHERGETQEARQWIGKAIESMEPHPSRSTQGRIEGRLLQRELERLLDDAKQEQDNTKSGQEE